jgi:hypothetical protein
MKFGKTDGTAAAVGTEIARKARRRLRGNSGWPPAPAVVYKVPNWKISAHTWA